MGKKVKALRQVAQRNPKDIKRDSNGRFARVSSGVKAAKKNVFSKSNIVYGAELAGSVGGGALLGGIGGVAGKIAAGALARKLTKQDQVVGQASAVGSGSLIGGKIGQHVGGHAGSAIGALAGIMGTKGVIHTRKAVVSAKAKVAKDEAFQSAGRLGKMRKTGSAIMKELKATSGEHRKEIKEEVAGWIISNVGEKLGHGGMAADIVSNYTAPFVNKLKRSSTKFGSKYRNVT